MKKLHVISQTHWDREWYQEFQGARKRLVYFIDELLDVMEKNPDYRYFHFDGQTILIEDYLEIKPENEQRLRKLIKDGRIIIGPWYVMPDEFLVSGESLVRNLLKGHLICDDYQTLPMKNGYIVDIFGHNSQFPQILKGFDIDSATLYRGIGDYEKSEFLWEAADGSRVIALKLDPDRSYSNFYFAVRWPFDGREYQIGEVKDRMTKLLQYMDSRAVTSNYLMMDGVDHIEIEPELPKLMDFISELEDVKVEHSTIDAYVKSVKEENPQLEVIKGELLKPGKAGVNNTVLYNVWSSMVHLKQMNNDCETMLTAWVEPLSTIRSIMGLGEYQKGFIKEAWKYVLMNHPHDSICGCSITKVHKDNEYRFSQARDIAQEMLEENLKSIQQNIDTSEFKEGYVLTLFNNSQKEFKGVVTVEIAVPSKPPKGTDNILLRNIDRDIPYQIIDIKKSQLKRILEYRRLPRWESVDVYTIAFEAEIPAVGYNTYNYLTQNTEGPEFGQYSYKSFYPPYRIKGTMQNDINQWDNREFKITVNTNGTLTILDKRSNREYQNQLLFEDGGDKGDGWNYRAPLKDSIVSGLTASSALSVENNGPLFTRLRIDSVLMLPTELRKDNLGRDTNTRSLTITTYINIRKGSRRLDFTSYIDNTIRDHRLRVLFPTGLKTDEFYTSTPFDLYKRPIKRPDYSSYQEPDTRVSPNQGAVVMKDEASCFALFNKGLYEVEAIDDSSRTLALTLFRSFRNEVGLNEGDMSNMLSQLKFDYAIYIGDSNETNGELMLESKEFREGIIGRYDVTGKGILPLTDSFMKIDAPGMILSCFKKAEDKEFYVLRFFNCENESVEGNIQFLKRVKKANKLSLGEKVVQELEVKDDVTIKALAKEIITLGIEF
jgi:mannosylglycerate hydrolase